jgi:AcrR family transcriptional regulator
MSQFTERQLQIIQVSIELISRRGVLGLTIKNISEAIGISEPAIYRHFDNKSAIILGIVSVLSDSFDEEFNLNSEKMDAVNKIKSIFNNLTSHFIENPALTAIVFSEEIFNNEIEADKIILNMMEKKQQKLIDVLTTGQTNGDIRTDLDAKQLSLIIIGSFRFLVSKWHLRNYAFDLEAEVEELLNSLEMIIIL